MEKGATAAPFFIAGEVGLAFLAGLLLPALGFLRHCLLSPPSCWDYCASAHAHHGGCRLARSSDVGARRFRGTFQRCLQAGKGELERLQSSFTRDGLL